MSIPRVDLTPLDPSRADASARAVVGAALAEALREVGFVTLVGHGARVAPIAASLAAAHRFFALSSTQKHALAPQRWNAASPNVYRGYFPSSAHGKEGFDLGEPALDDADEGLLAGPYAERNRYPEALGDAWRARMGAAFDAFHSVGHELVGLLAEALGGDARRAQAHFARPAGLSTLRFNFYPGLAEPVEHSAEDGAALACETHVDSGMLTLLVQDEVGGLQVRTREREWIDVPPEPGALVVNAGRALGRASDRELRATPHRVLHSAGVRLSVPFFLEPVPDCPVSPAALGLPAEAGEAQRYEDFLRESLAAFPEYQREGAG